MKMKFLSVFLIAVLCTVSACNKVASESRSLYQAKVSDKLDAERARLKSWKEKGGEKDPDYWVALANVLVQEGSESGIRITGDTGPLKGEGLELVDPKTGKKAGSIEAGETQYDPKKLEEAVKALEQALKIAPERMDIWTGRAHLLRLAGPVEPVLSALGDLVHAAMDGRPKKMQGPGQALKGDPRRYALDMVQAYTSEYFDKEAPEADAKGKAVAELTIKLFPNAPEGYNSLAGYYAFGNKWDLCLPLFLKAHKLDPKDDLVTNNLGYCYVKMGQKLKARPYYEYVAKHGTDEHQINLAKQRLGDFK